jgi:hypothetical protein
MSPIRRNICEKFKRIAMHAVDRSTGQIGDHAVASQRFDSGVQTYRLGHPRFISDDASPD